MKSNLAEKETSEIEVCEYSGKTYTVLTDMQGRNFIKVNDKNLYLDKNLKVACRQPGGRNAKDCVDSYEDMHKIYNYLIKQKEWNIFLLYVLNYNFGRRIGDLLSAKWKDMFNADWSVKKKWILTEQKTGKKNDIKINKAVVMAFDIYFENETEFEKTDETYNDYIFRQLHGTHKGKVLSQEGYRQALIRVGKNLNLDKNIRSHSFRRGAFTNMLESHPNDPKAKTIIMDISKHSSEQMLSHYIGESDKNKEKYIDDLGEDFIRYAVNGEKIPFQKKSPKVVCDTEKLLASIRDLAMYFMIKGVESANITDSSQIINIVNDSMKEIDKVFEIIIE